MQGEHLAHVKELQGEIAHVCNVLAAMEEKCKILEATQEDMGVMEGALKEIEALKAHIRDHEQTISQHEQTHAELQDKLAVEVEKTSQYEEHIVAEQQAKAKLAEHLHRSVGSVHQTQLRTTSMG